MRLPEFLFRAALIPILVVFAFPVSSTAWQDPIPDPIPKSNTVVELELIADDLTAPNLLTHSGDQSGRLFIVDQSGEIWLIKDGELQTLPYLDASSLLVSLGGLIPPFQDPFSDFDERGLLGLAFHPNFSKRNQPGFGKFYTYTSEPVAGPADFTVDIPAGESFNHQSVIREWSVDPGADVILGDPDVISRILFRVDQPQFNHDAGMLEFGPDDLLYIAFGDGGGANDSGVGHGADGNGQDSTNVLGTILRIDPLGVNSANGAYGIPADNPFIGGQGLDEIFAYGLRNPFRFSFDVDPLTGKMVPGTTGELIVADVGQGNIEEVDIVQSGDNLGWRLKEGTFFFNPDTGGVSETPFPGIPIPPTFDPVDPVLQYDHDEGISIIGGFVYRGTEIPELTGKYVFGDFTNAGFFIPGGRIFVGDLETGEIEELRLGFESSDLGLFVKGFGQDANGELYVMAGPNLGPFRDSTGQGFGVVFRIVSATSFSRPNWKGFAKGSTEPDPDNSSVRLNTFEGRSSFLGRFKGTGTHEIDDELNLNGMAVLESPNGDAVEVSYQGFVFESDSADLPWGFKALMMIDSGTGRFSSSKGTAVVEGSFNDTTEELRFDFNGELRIRDRGR